MCYDTKVGKCVRCQLWVITIFESDISGLRETVFYFGVDTDDLIVWTSYLP